jgi:exopolyphosphatase / guanosine-5'-triphosphate,3'-diphosphate pyrophosphatase
VNEATLLRPDDRGDRDGADRPAPFAVVDIGSNSIRLVVYERPCRAPIALFNEKSLCGLGASLATTGRLGRGEMDCALRALRRFAHIARALRAREVEYVATEAVRRAANGSAFLAEAERATGQNVAVLSGHDEAHAAAMGVAHSFYRPDGVVGDLGGGSVDLSVVTPDGPTAPYGSLPMGTLPVTRVLLEEGQATAARRVDERLASLPWLAGAARDRRFYVVGGGWRALARIRLAITDTPLKVVHDYALSAEEAIKLGRGIAGLAVEELRTMPGMPGRRVDTVRAAALLLERVVRAIEPETVVFSAFGLREGRVFLRLPPEELALDPLLAGAVDFGRSRARVPSIGAAMGDWTAAVSGEESAAQRRLRLAACEVSDSAWREHPAFRAREAFYRLAQYPFIGLTHADRAFLAYTVFIRYEGRPDDVFIRPILSLLPEDGRRRAELLGATLQLGFRISAAVPDLLATSRLRVAGDELRLHLPAPDAAPDPEILNPRLRAVARALGMERVRVVTTAA